MDEPCREILIRLETYLDRECPAGTASTIEAHLEGCPPCLQQADFRREFRILVATRCRDAAPSGLLERVRAMLLDVGPSRDDAV